MTILKDKDLKLNLKNRNVFSDNRLANKEQLLILGKQDGKGYTQPRNLPQKRKCTCTQVWDRYNNGGAILCSNCSCPI